MPRQFGAVGDDLTSRSHPVQEDMGLQRTTWTVERLGWAVMAAAVVAALLGVFARGPLASAVAAGGAGLEVSYGRFERSEAATRLKLTVSSVAGPNATVLIDKAFLNAFAVKAIHPRPFEERSTSDGTELVFRTTRGAPLRVHFELLPTSVGPVRSEIALAGESPARLFQFVYP